MAFPFRGFSHVMYIRFQSLHGDGLFAEMNGSVFLGYWLARTPIRRRDRRRFQYLYDWLCAFTPSPPANAYVDEVSRHPRTWYKKSATEHVSIAWRMCTLLNRYGSRVAPVSSPRPGFILYEDNVQIVVRPNRENIRPARKPPRTTPGWNGDRTTIRRWRAPASPLSLLQPLLPQSLVENRQNDEHCS